MRAVLPACATSALVAVGIRVLVARRTHGLIADGAVELTVARALREGRWADALDTHFHPLYAALVALVSALGFPDQRAGELVAVLASSLVAPACALAAALLAPRRPRAAAFAGGLLAAAHPYLARIGGQVMAYSVAHACLALALALLLLALRSKSRLTLLAALAGAAVGLGYLARSDGVTTGLGLGLALTVFAVRGPNRLRRLPAVVAFGAAVLVCMSPYLIAIRLHSGQWRLTLKKDVGVLLSVPPPEGARPPDPSGVAAPPPALAALIRAEGTGQDPRGFAGTPTMSLPRAALHASHIAVKAGHLLFVVLALLALLAPVPRGSERGFRLAPLPRGWYAPLLALLTFVLAHTFLKANWGYTSRIHQSAVGLLLAPLAARGLVYWTARYADPRHTRRWHAGVLSVGLVVLLPKTLVPQRVPYARDREVAEWLIRDAGPLEVGPICGRDTRVVAYHAGAPFLIVPPGPPREALAAARAQGARYLVLFLRSSGPLPGHLERALLEAGLEPARAPFRAEHEGKRYTWFVYRLQ